MMRSILKKNRAIHSIINIVICIASFFIGIFFNETFVSSLIINIGYGVLPVPIQLLLLFSEIIVFYVFIKFLLNLTDCFDKYLLLVAYLSLLGIVLLGRPSGDELVFGINPIAFIFESLSDLRSLATTFLNLLVLFPIQIVSILFKHELSLKKGLLVSVCIAFVIEILQMVLSRGIFDISDIVVYTIGYILGYYVAKCIIFIHDRLSKHNK